MSHNSIVSYLSSQTENSLYSERRESALHQKLSKALEQYQRDLDVQTLNSKYFEYLLRNENLENTTLNLRVIVEALKTFNIAPSNSYDRYMSVIKNQTDFDAIRSDWEVVGEGLSASFAKNIIDQRK
jgi:hypothetical protein